jgi:putative DNA primase/helicase
MTTDATYVTLQNAKGRWPDILRALGFDAKLFNRKQQACPMCGGEDRFQFTNRTGEGDYICRGCGAGKGMKLLMAFRQWDFRTAAQEVDKVVGTLPASKPLPAKPTSQITQADLKRLWARGQEITAEDPAGRYLAARGLKFGGMGEALRYVPALPHYGSKTIHPGMLAKFRDVTGATKQIQRTYLTEGGRKAPLEPNRMFMPGVMPAGGAIRLGGPREAMGVAEGVETALAAADRFLMTVWATTSAEMLQKWMPPPEALHITVFGDNDGSFTGQAAAYALAKRLVHEAAKAKITRTVEVRIPERPDSDWADA